jgi:hypothetical protein
MDEPKGSSLRERNLTEWVVLPERVTEHLQGRHSELVLIAFRHFEATLLALLS